MDSMNVMVEKRINVDGYDKETIAMTIGANGKNFINWTENTPGINFIWHNREKNEIEIKGSEEAEFNNVIKTIKNVLNFNRQIILDREQRLQGVL